MYISKRSGMNHIFYLQIRLPFLRKRSPDGATPNWCRRHPIAAYYLSIDSERIKSWVAWLVFL